MRAFAVGAGPLTLLVFEAGSICPEVAAKKRKQGLPVSAFSRCVGAALREISTLLPCVGQHQIEYDTHEAGQAYAFEGEFSGFKGHSPYA